ncbi:MAG TPA: hypothetical protein VGK73_02260 [Polyangiaceae bacterium]
MSSPHALPLLTDFLPVGDAACSLDPMSGAGLLFALRSGIDAAGAVADGASGRTQAYGEYQAGLLAALRLHARERTHAYAAERRFPESSFWRAAQRDIAAGL